VSLLNWLFGNRRTKEYEPWDARRVLATWKKGVPLTAADLRLSVMVTGMLGGGKTSGSGNFILKTALTNDFGAMLMAVKADEPSRLISVCEEMGRKVLLFGPGHDHVFNPFQQEVETLGYNSVESIAALFESILEIMERGKEQGQGENP